MVRTNRYQVNDVWFMKRNWGRLVENEPVRITQEKFLATDNRWSVVCVSLLTGIEQTVPVKVLRKRKH